MKKIISIVLILLIISICSSYASNASSVWFEPPAMITFSHNFHGCGFNVDDFIYWIETGEKPRLIHPDSDFEPLLSLIRQNDSILTVETIAESPYRLDWLRVAPQGHIIYNFSFRGQAIRIEMFLMGYDGTNRPIREVVADFAEQNQEVFQTEQIYKIQYATATINRRGHVGVKLVALESKPLERVDLYYFHGIEYVWIDEDGLTHRQVLRQPFALFEIDNVHIRIELPMPLPEPGGSTLLPRTNWDSSYLDMFQFISRPINVGGNAPIEALPYGEIRVTFNGARIALETSPVIVDNCTLVPIRFLAEALGDDVEWIDETREVVVRTLRGRTSSFAIDEAISPHRVWWTNEVVARIIDDRIFISLRLASDIFGLDIDWNEDIRTVLIAAD